ncbi:ras and ef-hand domain-containing protein [Anaeramoeba ignava]|uniref:Ras and ef-hand domain-containing protein n=1 Tax=Anaeramoeba ignava TaxID=1746090 RepID=A0A9Q0LQ60_ANAIG|nr:ras and ef-hand domain-containing protein [Anaeramoeba ignava]
MAEEKTLKFLLIGTTLVGKSSIMMRFCENKFLDNIGTTIGVDFKFAEVNIENEKIKLEIWDTAGQDRFRSITPSYYRNTNGIMIVYDITNEETFEHISTWFQEIKTNAPEDVVISIVGNKSDLENERVVPTKKGQKMATSYDCLFFEMSAKSGKNVRESFEKMAIQAFKVMKKTKKKPTKEINFASPSVDKKKCC